MNPVMTTYIENTPHTVSAEAVTPPVTGAAVRTARFPALPGTPRVLAVSARDETAAAAMCRRLADRLERDPSLSPDDVAVTLAHGRERFAVRHAVTGTDGPGLAAALRRSAGLPRPAGTARPLVLDLGDGSAPAEDPPLPQVAEALEAAAALGLPPGPGRDAARAAAVLHGVGAWLAAHGLRPDTVRGLGPAASAAAALRGAVPLADALRAAATASPEEGEAAVADGPELVVRVTGPGTPDDGDGDGLRLDPLDASSYARLFARLWEWGLDVDCSLGAPGRRTRLPGYPFRRSGPVAGPPEGLRPLKPAEQRPFFHDLVRRGDAAERVLSATAVRPGPAPAPADVEAALAGLLDRHPHLRTVFTRHAGRWFATASREPVRVEVLAPDERGEPGARALAATLGTSFAAADVPLLRCALAPADGRWAVALAVYSPVAGASSADGLLGELLTGWPRPA
ncbi:CurL C-terminal domain-containing protein [Streptomyces sp. NPDC002640]